MKEKEKELMERYIYEVIRRVPAEQKEDIRLELLELIGDMYEADENGMESVLSKLGDPKIFAKKYRDESNHVIGPEYYDNYLWVLKIVLACVAGSAILSAIVQPVLGEITVEEAFIKLIADGIASLLGAFGAVTLVFGILERKKIAVDLKEEQKWNIKDLEESIPFEGKRWSPAFLSPVPDKRALISRGESTASLIFIMIFCGLAIFAPWLFGAYVFENGEFVRTIPVFNLDKWNYILPFLILCFLAEFADQMLRLVMGCYCKAVMVSGIVTGVFQIVFAALAIKVLPFFNPDFVTGISEEFDMKLTSRQDILSYWGSDFFGNIIMAAICAITFLEVGMTIYKTYRYGVRS